MTVKTSTLHAFRGGQKRADPAELRWVLVEASGRILPELDERLGQWTLRVAAARRRFAAAHPACLSRAPLGTSLRCRTRAGPVSSPFGVNLVLEREQDARLDACLEEGAQIVSFFWGNPAPYLDRVHQAGGVVMHTVGSAAEARQRADDGVDVIVTQGAESGGHVWGQVSTMALVPAVVDAVGPVPVIAAGGIADARGIAAAMALGASGVWMGTRFVATLESSAHPVYKHAMLEAVETDTIYTTVFDGGWPDAPHRVLRNSTTARTESGAGGPADRPGAGEVIAHFADGTPVIRYAADEPLAGMEGEVEAMALYAGQSTALVHDVPSASALVPSP